MSLHKRAVTALGLVLSIAAMPMACSDTAAPAGPVFECQLPSGSESPDFLQTIGCNGDFQALASEPLRADLPGARSVKVVLDQADGNALYFQNSVLYKIHYEFASKHLSGKDLPLVPELSSFNTTEYYTPDRRFVLGAVTYYEGPKVWALEIAPYDTASAAMITTLYKKVAASAYFGGSLFFHPTSDAVSVEADKLGDDVPVKTTDELYAAIDYQPLSLGSSMGRLRFLKAADLEDEYVSHEDIVVLDEAPNDISVIQGLITEEFQTPLSHVNVLSQNRGTPNMGLRHAMTNPALRALEGNLIELTVGASTWSVREVTLEEAQAYWDEHKPDPVVLPTLDLSVTGLWDLEDVTPEPASGASLRDAIKQSVLAFGGKAAHYSILTRTENVPIQKAFAIPVYYYDQFMKQNGFYDQIDALLADPTFQADAAVRDQKLEALRDAMEAAPVDAAFQALLKDKIAAEYGTHKMRFRTSTNSEDLEGFPCAGCYESHTGDPTDWPDVLEAIRETYASAWLFRTFEERSYYGIDHKSIGMALLVHHNFPDEEANGVAVTANPFDEAGVDPAFYVNVQYGGDVEVVAPPPGVTSDQFLYYFTQPNQPITYLTHSSLLAEGERVLTTAQIHSLGVALDAIHARFSPAYGPAAGNKGWYAMDIEFKFDDEAAPGQTPTLYIKQARPYPGRGSE
ncbi:PEP/pyruvate-binding domain-containing protein [Polyangium fumosum]|uniref:Phosphoenolpyruvate synthase n=1 Tax=Polyangium fumosum TaxID=889272 RepID=A0A4U1IH15_9BACT|nr:PEP/pyruvate-binding domain-containing protein [Polyangium fumosum]TKC93011.1 hypothetical protein E8A74_50075 [Polyangium fumosum]